MFEYVVGSMVFLLLSTRKVKRPAPLPPTQGETRTPAVTTPPVAVGSSAIR